MSKRSFRHSYTGGDVWDVPPHPQDATIARLLHLRAQRDAAARAAMARAAEARAASIIRLIAVGLLWIAALGILAVGLWIAAPDGAV